MSDCVKLQKIYVIPPKTDEYGYTKDKIPRPRKKVYFNIDPHKLVPDVHSDDPDVLEEAIFRKFLNPLTGETASVYDIPCGKCLACRQNHALEWSLRLQMERTLYERNDDCCFLTLDYNDLFVPRLADGRTTLRHSDIQQFLRRLRYLVKKEDPQARLRFFAAGEYGSKSERSHYHLVLFGYDFFRGAQYVRKSRAGFALFHNKLIDDAWTVKRNGSYVPLGGALFGMFSPADAMYTSQYVVKKVASDFEADGRKEPYIQMSRDPGLGHDFIVQHKDEILVDKGIYLNGRFIPLSRYMMKVFLKDTASGNYSGILSIDFERRKLAKDRAELRDRAEQAVTDRDIRYEKLVIDELKSDRYKLAAKMKGSAL